MWNRKDRIRRMGRRKSLARRIIPSIESMESRLVLSGTGFLQGMVYSDSNGNNQYDPLNGDTPQCGALVQLIQNNTVLRSGTTGPDGSYLFTGLAPGTYQVQETPPSGYKNEGTQANSPLNPVTAKTSSTITVQVEDLSSLSVTYDAPYQFANLDPSLIIFKASPDNGKTYVPEEYSIGQMPVTVAYPGGSTARFSAYCVDVFSILNYGMDTFTASGQPLSSTLVPNTNAGAIAYLDNHYGALAAQTPTSLSQAYDLQALQLAIWKLVYDTGTNLTTFSSGNIQQLSIDTRYNNYPGVKNDTSLNDLESRALAYINEGLQHSEQAVELEAISGTNGYQDLVAPGSLSFGNTPKATPSISTTPSLATVSLGTSSVILTDQAVLSGGSSPTGSITFALYQGTTLVDSETVPVSGDGTYSTPTGYTPPATGTVTGTYQWVATYNSDANNNAVSDAGAANEQVTIGPAGPAITTTANPISEVVGTTALTDTAHLTGGYNPTGLITLTLTAPDGSVVDTESATVNGDGDYSTPAGYVPTEVGTYYWVASYGGDANNASVTTAATDEPMVIGPASPGIMTRAAATAGGAVGMTLLSDSAVLSGGYMPGGSITFTLTAPDGTTLQEGPITVTGDGTYSTPTPVLATLVGTYSWSATYSGDGMNNSAIDDGTNESLTTVKAGPSIATSANGTSGLAVGTSVLSDSAVLSGGYGIGGGTITFTLMAPDGSTAASEVVAVAGAGTYSTPAGVLATQVGTYTWHASYSGDALNNGAIDDGSNESVTIVKAGPTLTTTAGGTVVVGSIVIGGTKYLDLTGDGFSSDDTPKGGVTINLYLDSNGTAGLQVGGGGDTLVASTTTASDGTYNFTVNSPGTYYVQEAVPSGYLQTGGGPNGSAGNTYYTIVATGGHGYSENNFDDFLIPDCNCSAPSFRVTANGSSKTVTNLSGNTQQGATVTATFKVPAGTTEQFTLVSYIAPSPSFSDSNAYQQVIYQKATGTYTSPGTYSLTVQIPNSYYQIDFVCGAAIGQLEPNQNHNAYGPDSAEILYHAQQRFISGDSGGKTAPCPMPAPTPATPPTPTPTLGTSLTLTDSATLSGGNNPTGQIGFTLYAPDGTVVYTDTVPVDGDGTYTTSVGDHPGGYVPTVAGAYQWVAVYSGDQNNAGAHDQGGLSEQETVSPAAPAIATTPSPTCAVVNTAALEDTAILSGGYNPTGQIVFTLVSPGGIVVDTETVPVHGDGAYTTPNGYIPIQSGTYYWVASYSGDTNNVAVAGGAHDEPVVVSAPTNCVARGDFATIGFWNNKNGQSLIFQLNGGGTSGSATALGNWLAASFPHLYGSSADPSNPYEANLAGLTNAQVAHFYQKLFQAGGLNKTHAQIMAVALAAYATDASLAGGNYARSFGFTMHAGGSGTDVYNVGSNGSALGLSKNTSYAVLNLLAAADQVAAQGTGKLDSQLSGINTIFNGINAKGDIS